MVARREPHHVSVDEWRTLNRNTQGLKYEYIDGRVYLMVGGTANHSRISINVVRAIEDALGDSPCNVYYSDLSVRLYGPGDMIELASLSIQIPLAALYRRTTVKELLSDVGDIDDPKRRNEIL